MQEKRTGNDRRAASERRLGSKKPWLMRISLIEKRGGLDRRSGLDRRAELSSDYHHEAIIEVTKKGMIKHWDSAKAKMTYLWDTGLKAITFADFHKGRAVEVTVNTHQEKLVLLGHVLRIQKIFTERGFATEMDIQFESMDDRKRAFINQIIWGD